MFLSKRQLVFRIILFSAVIVLMGVAAALTVHYANISALNAPHNYRGVFI